MTKVPDSRGGAGPAPRGPPQERKPVTGYLIRRVAQAAVVVLLVTVITFILLRAIPGNVAVAILGPSGFRNPATLAAFNREYGFDKPWFDQYLLWLGHLLQGNLGFSWTLDQSVSSELDEHLPKTIILAGLARALIGRPAMIVADERSPPWTSPSRPRSST